MITDAMSKKEVMITLRNEYREEIHKYYNNSLKPSLEKYILPTVQRTGSSKTIQYEKKSKGNIEYHILCEVTKEKPFVCTYRSFYWNKNPYFASFFENDSVVVYSKHCMDRYKERVLHMENENIPSEEIFKKFIFSKQDSAFSILLQAPNFERTLYMGLADALFLGDFDEPTKENMNDHLYWYNTCISFEQFRHTQEGLHYSLLQMQTFVQKLGFNPVDNKDKRKLNLFLKQSKENESEYVNFLKRTYMLCQFQLDMNFPWIELYKPEHEKMMELLSRELAKYKVSTASLSPYGKKNGFALKGEIIFSEKELE
jgi:hypothetical protein